MIIEILRTRVLPNPEIQTVIWDTAKELYNIITEGHLQEKQEAQLEFSKRKFPEETDLDKLAAQTDNFRQQLQPMEYAIPYTRFETVVKLCTTMQKNVVLINHEKDVYRPMVIDGKVVSQPTGEKELDGYRKTLDLTDWAFISKYDKETRQFGIQIIKSPLGMEMVGMELTDPSYDKLVSLCKLIGRELS